MPLRGLACVLVIICSVAALPAALAQQPPSGKSMPPSALLYRYLDLKQALLSQHAGRIWDVLEGKATPLMRLTVISTDPPGQPAPLGLAPTSDGPAEVTLRLERPPSFEVVPGMQVGFEGVARELTKQPFHLTLSDASVRLQPVITLSVEPKAIRRGEPAVLRWSTKDAYGVVLFPDGVELAPSGLQGLSPRETTTYTLVAKGRGGEAEASVVVAVQPDLK